MRVMPAAWKAAAARRREAGQGGGGGGREGGAGGGGLVGVDLCVGERGVVVDGAVHVLVADPRPASGAAVRLAVAAQDAPPAAVAEPADLLHVDVDQLAGPGPLVAANQLAGRAVQPGEAGPPRAAPPPVARRGPAPRK